MEHQQCLHAIYEYPSQNADFSRQAQMRHCFVWRREVASILNAVDPALRGKFEASGFIVETDNQLTYNALLSRGFVPMQVEQEVWDDDDTSVMPWA